MKNCIYIWLILFPACENGSKNNSVERTNKIARPVINSDTLKKQIKKKPDAALIEFPAIEEKKGKCSLILTKPIKKLLADYDPDFKIWKRSDFVRSIDGNADYHKCSEQQTPYAVIGEFNGDDIRDIILMGRNKKWSLLLGIISSEQTHKVIEIKKYDLVNPKDDWIDNENNTGLSSCLYYCSPLRAAEKMKVKYKNDAFLRGIYGKASSIFWYENGIFKTATYSD